MVGTGSSAIRSGYFKKYIMADFLNITFLTFLCATAFSVLKVRANALEPVQELKLRNNDELGAKINEVFDDLLPEIRDIIIMKGLDPMKMPDIAKKLDGILGKSGELSLSHGWMQGMVQLKRSGDVVVSYKDKIITLDALLGLDFIDVAYDYQFKYWIVSRSGNLHARLSDMKVRTVIKVDMIRYKISLESFQTTSVSKIDVKLEGGIVDKILNAAIKVFIGAFRKHIIETMENSGTAIIREQLEKINEKIPRPAGTPQVMDLDDSAMVRNNDWDNMIDNIPTYIKFGVV